MHTPVHAHLCSCAWSHIPVHAHLGSRVQINSSAHMHGCTHLCSREQLHAPAALYCSPSCAPMPAHPAVRTHCCDTSTLLNAALQMQAGA